ncbi:TPA: hypothetical protein IAC10_05285 [Candidatus Scatousia excrementigallinarum]|uniref:Uncharacterized protein n=1 Tax=Candidatus Scatousia excrementigallinarum TaxID=2840935 RepID=A0A9D1EY26_9BACT|nr:hypothetical protein [Candidatus Scatousia excrementigallinarum]
MEITSVNNELVKDTVKLQQKNIAINPASSFWKEENLLKKLVNTEF